ncbi:hypothetical protein OYE22_19425 [Streptomyces sp. 71268]|uniref:hypothetical protein n=1 Tax=Streptomyces sp. 71268 TaxID=3002640 RepID=UPI0023F6C437|nr:hypothetical protein [Streptomyces sp. 71268]WEV27125.1 hypothetical protein OYE22_19425 [Streptomyces sp. 71268]
MNTTRAAGAPRELAGGLVLREACPGDLEQIGALLAARGAEEDALDHRLVVTDPDAGWAACAVVVDGERVVSTATLLDEEVRLGDVRLPAGQVESPPTGRTRDAGSCGRSWGGRTSARPRGGTSSR